MSLMLNEPGYLLPGEERQDREIWRVVRRALTAEGFSQCSWWSYVDDGGGWIGMENEAWERGLMTLTEEARSQESSDSSIQLLISPLPSQQLIWFKQPVGKPRYMALLPQTNCPQVFQSSTNFSTWETDSLFRRGVGIDSEEIHLEFCIKDFSFSDVLMQLFEPGN